MPTLVTRVAGLFGVETLSVWCVVADDSALVPESALCARDSFHHCQAWSRDVRGMGACAVAEHDGTDHHEPGPAIVLCETAGAGSGLRRHRVSRSTWNTKPAGS